MSLAAFPVFLGFYRMVGSIFNINPLLLHLEQFYTIFAHIV